MPKETVQYPAYGTPVSTEVTVHWNKAGDMPGYVQIQTERHVWADKPDNMTASGHVKVGCDCKTSDQGCGALPQTYVDSSRDAEKVAAADAGEGPDNPYARDRLAQRSIVITDVMDRDQINTLIRTLRRARDQAYGADA